MRAIWGVICVIEQVTWDESKSHGMRASHMGREQVTWDESKSHGMRASYMGCERSHLLCHGDVHQ